MRKLLLLIPFVFTIALSHAQMQQGKIVIGASSTFGLMGTGSDVMNIGFSNINYKSDADGFTEPDPDKMTSINLLPKVGYTVVDGLMIGVDLSFAYRNNEDNDGYSSSNTLFSAGPFVRYYIPTSFIRPFVEATSSFGSVNYTYDSPYSGSDESKESLIALGGGAGVAIPIGTKVSFDALVHYTSFTMKETEDNPDNFRTTVGTFGLKLGFTVFLGK